MRFLFLVLYISFSLFSYGQNRHDAQWILGQNGEIKMDYTFDSPDVSLKTEVDFFTMSSSNISMCDADGNLLFYSNGCEIRDRQDSIMTNGENISPGILKDFFCNSGAFSNPISQGIITLPVPGSLQKYYLFNLDASSVTYSLPDTTITTLDPKTLYYSIIDMSLNAGLGEVISKNNIAVGDSLALARGQLTAVKHANGIDWWIVIPKALSNCYYFTLLTSEGLSESKLVCSGEEWNTSHGIGQAVFTPDGSRFARFNPWNGLHIFDFDRCEGQLSNPISIDFSQDTFGAAGLSISSNSRFLYASAVDKLYQFDLESDNIESSRILIDTLNLINIPSFSAAFYLSQLAPNNKIYIAGIGSHRFLHVINQPDSLGLACDFKQQAIELPALNFASIPNFPNYNLGELPDPCDPMTQVDVSPNPKHSKNSHIYPNPASDYISFVSEDQKVNESQIDLFVYNVFGNEALVEKNIDYSSRIDISNIKSGTYFYQIVQNAKVINIGKFVVLR